MIALFSFSVDCLAETISSIELSNRATPTEPKPETAVHAEAELLASKKTGRRERERGRRKEKKKGRGRGEEEEEKVRE